MMETLSTAFGLLLLIYIAVSVSVGLRSGENHQLLGRSSIAFILAAAWGGVTALYLQEVERENFGVVVLLFFVVFGGVTGIALLKFTTALMKLVLK